MNKIEKSLLSIIESFKTVFQEINRVGSKNGDSGNSTMDKVFAGAYNSAENADKENYRTLTSNVTSSSVYKSRAQEKKKTKSKVESPIVVKSSTEVKEPDREE